MEAELENPYILIYDKDQQHEGYPAHTGESSWGGRPLLIIAEDLEGEALATLVWKTNCVALKVAAAKAPVLLWPPEGNVARTSLSWQKELSRMISEEQGI